LVNNFIFLIKIIIKKKGNPTKKIINNDSDENIKFPLNCIVAYSNTITLKLISKINDDIIVSCKGVGVLFLQSRIYELKIHC
jgi:hypothetical protein